MKLCLGDTRATPDKSIVKYRQSIKEQIHHRQKQRLVIDKHGDRLKRLNRHSKKKRKKTIHTHKKKTILRVWYSLKETPGSQGSYDELQYNTIPVVVCKHFKCVSTNFYQSKRFESLGEQSIPSRFVRVMYVSL